MSIKLFEKGPIMAYDRKDPYEQEEDELCDALNRGEISNEEYNRRIRAINRQRRDDYEQAREDAMERFEADYGNRW
jgi:predicted RNA-binding protein associated with RNAse of E/G family